MTPCRTIEILTPIRAVLIACGLTAGLSLGAAAETRSADDALLRPTPLILKDGRIANVSVHTVGFPPGQSALGPASTQRLAGLTREMATDCFLTAQVIGHVGTAEVGNDTLKAHRLARARADAVQASLIAGGLPAKAIASVWDWQFMVREPRATLWVFRLTPGEDCDDTPLESAAPALVAGAEPPSAPVPNGEARPASAPGAGLPPGPTSAGEPRADQAAATVPERGAARVAPAAPDQPTAPTVAVQAVEPPPAEAARVIQALPAVSPSPAKAPAGPSGPAPAAVDHKPAAVAAEPKPAANPPPEVIAALPERTAVPPVEPAAAERQAAVDAKPEALVITFPTNSSYFPPDTSTQLGALVQQLANDQRYEVVLQLSVSGSDKVVGAESPDEAAQNNKWLADRRVDRVRDWFGQHV
jgi:outer membrane protein OmpA-like peptidoglycan-associated protein